jgi:hypothetical protein
MTSFPKIYPPENNFNFWHFKTLIDTYTHIYTESTGLEIHFLSKWQSQLYAFVLSGIYHTKLFSLNQRKLQAQKLLSIGNS